MTPDYKIHYYNEDKEPKIDWAIVGAAAIIIIGMIVALCSCYTQKHAQKQLNKAHDTYPALTAQDLSTWYPPTAPTVIQGKTITKTVIKIDSAKAKALNIKIDSLFSIIGFQDTLIKSTPNIDSLRKSITDEVLRGCGTFDETDSVIQHDTTNIIPSTTLVQTAFLLADTSSKHDAIIALTVQRDNYKSDFDKSRLWLIILLVALGLFGAYKLMKLIYPSVKL